jgi:type I restriction enzyme S subunit
MTEWKECKLGDVVFFSNGKSRPDTSGYIPIYGGNGILEYTDQSNNDGETIIIGRVGAYCGSVYYENRPVWVSDNALAAKPKEQYYAKYLYYLLKFSDLNQYAEGSSHPLLTQSLLNSIDIVFCDNIDEQKAIAEVLSSLDDKIDLLTRQNKTLEDLAQAYFRKWFIEDASDEWEVGKLGDYIEIHDSKRVPLSKIEREKMKSGTLYPYYGAATIMDYVNDYIFDGEYILMGEDGTVETEDGYPVLQYATGKFWVNNHAHVLTAKSPFNNYFIWFFLKQCNISGIVTGAVQPKINQENLKNIDIPIPDLTLINSANQFFANIFAKILNRGNCIIKFLKLNKKEYEVLAHQ